jgi:hypothetical protein
MPLLVHVSMYLERCASDLEMYACGEARDWEVVNTYLNHEH